MAVTKLSASAPPYHSAGYVHRTTPPAYITVYQYNPCNFHPAPAGSRPFPVVATGCSGVPLFAPAPYPTYSLPTPLGATVPAVPCKAPPAVPPCCNAAPLPPSPPPAVPVVAISCNAAPLPPPPPPAAARPVPISWLSAPLTVLPPHGSAPHKMMLTQAQAAAQVQAAVLTSVKPGQEPVPAAGPHPRGREAWQRSAGVRARRRQEELAGARARPARSLSPVFTTRPPSPPVLPPEWFKQPVTTVMIRNIPVKLTPGEMMRLLDDHCARANRKAKRGGGGVISAYDFLYLRMDFSMRCNMGYAFVNLTTAEAARGLYCALHGSRWKVFASKKVIHVCPARLQGKDAQVRHLRAATYACDTDEFLPTVFSPPRDGADPCSPVDVNRVGHRVPHPPLAAGRRAPPPAVRPALPPRQAWRPLAYRRGRLPPR